MEGESVARQLDRLGWRLDALDGWRKDLDARFAVLESEVLTEREARRLSEALRLQNAEHQRLRLTGWQAAAAWIVAAAALADLAKGLLG